MDILARTRAASRSRTRGSQSASPSAPLTPAQVRHGLRLSNIEGALATVHVSITMSAFITGFALLLGARDFELGVMGALPFVGQLFQFVSAYLEERLGERKRLVLYTSMTSRALWAVIAGLPFMAWLGGSQLAVFLFILACSQALLGITANAWTSWMVDLVPPRQRGRYFGLRNTVAAVSAMLSTWLAGLALDHFRALGNEPMGYAVVFGAAVFFALCGGVVLRFQPEPPMQRRQQQVNIRELFSAPIRHRSFRTFAFAGSGWAVVTGIAAPFFNAYGIQNLHLSFQELALMGIITSGVALFTQPIIGRMQDKYGDKRVLVLSTLGVVLLPWGWVLSTPSFLLPVWLTAIFSGVFWPGINQGMVNLLMDRAPAEGRGAYLAAYGAINGAGTFVASLLGGVVATALATMVLQAGPIQIGHYTVLFILSSLGRAAMAGVFARKI